MSFPPYFEAFDAKRMLADYPIGDAFTARYTGMSRDELHSIEAGRFAAVMTRSVGNTGSIAGEGPERDGMYVWKDAPGGTAALTQIDVRQKPICLIDERGV